MNVLSPFDETVRDLSLAQHLPRIKKLLVYACTHHWENDLTGLSSYHLHELVQQLLHLAPTLQELKAHLNSVIHSLNKPAEYTLIANTIVRHLRRLYPEAIAHSSEHYQSLYQMAAHQLAQDDEHVRIKKLLYFVCRDQWTQDLANVNLADLVGEIYILTPTQADLNAVLDSVIQNVSKPEKYQAIAQRIAKGLAPLYSPTTHAVIEPSSSTEILSPSPTIAVGSPMVLIPTQVSQSEGGEIPTVTDDCAPPNPPSSFTYPERPAATVSPPTQPSQSVSMRKKVASLSMDDLFSLRIEIHKFTNPLLAKYVLLMNSYAAAIGSSHDSAPGKWDSMTWDALRSTDLDTLLRDGLKSCRDLGEFERGLKRTMRQLSGSQQYRAVISAIVRAVRPIFAECQEPKSLVQPSPRSAPGEMPTCGKQRSHDSLPSQPLSSDRGQEQPLQQEHSQVPTLLEVEADPSQSPLQWVARGVSGLETTEADSEIDATEAEPTTTHATHSESSGSESFGSELPGSLLPSVSVQEVGRSDQETECFIENDLQLDAQRNAELLKAERPQSKKTDPGFQHLEGRRSKNNPVSQKRSNYHDRHPTGEASHAAHSRQHVNHDETAFLPIHSP